MTNQSDDDFELSLLFRRFSGDEVIVRPERIFVVRRIRRWQSFVPQSAFVSLEPWKLVIGILYGLIRRLPPLVSPGWQVGVFWLPNVKDPGGKYTVLTKEFVKDEADALTHQHALVGQVHSGSFDKA